MNKNVFKVIKSDSTNHKSDKFIDDWKFIFKFQYLCDIVGIIKNFFKNSGFSFFKKN